MGDILSLMGYVQDQGEKGRARGLSQLIGKAYNAPPDQRQAVLGQVANVDGGMAMDAQKAFGEQDEAVHDQIIKRAAMVASLYKQNPQMAQAAYQGLPELAARGGFGQVPPQLDDKVAAALDSMVQAARQSGTGGNVQSTYIDDKGQRVAIMRDGSVQVLGANAPNNQIIDTGNGFFGVNKGSLQAAPVMTGGQTAPQQQRAPGEVPFSIDPSLPPEVQADIRANEAKYAQAQDGGEIGIGGGGGVAQGAPMGGQLHSVPKPPSPIEQQRLQLAQEAAQRAAQAQQLAQRGNAPAGYRFKMDGSLERIPGAPLPPAAAKTNTALAAKMPQLQNAIRGMDRIDSALSKLDGAMVNTGPLDQYAQKFTPAGQELEAAVGSIQNSILALTRVPGIGSQSDLEARVAMLQYPSLDKPPEVNKRTLANLKLFLRDLQSAYQTATQGGGQPSQDQPPASGWSIQAVP